MRALRAERFIPRNAQPKSTRELELNRRIPKPPPSQGVRQRVGPIHPTLVIPLPYLYLHLCLSLLCMLWSRVYLVCRTRVESAAADELVHRPYSAPYLSEQGVWTV